MDIKNKLRKIKLESFDDVGVLEVSTSRDFLIHYDTSSQDKLVDLTKRIDLKFLNSDLSSDIYLRIVIDRPMKLNLEVALMAPVGIKGIRSKLDMRALILHPEADVTFVPMLEIDEMDVSVDHKSTIGAPPRSWVQFMQSRGLDEKAVYKIVREAFVAI